MRQPSWRVDEFLHSSWSPLTNQTCDLSLVARRISEIPASLHRDRCGTSIVFNTSEDRWKSFRDATEILTMCTLRLILEPVLQHLSSVLLEVRVNFLPMARHGGTSTEDPERAVGKMRREETN